MLASPNENVYAHSSVAYYTEGMLEANAYQWQLVETVSRS